jgi:tetratricopeptide (TPR) repeat protein
MTGCLSLYRFTGFATFASALIVVIFCACVLAGPQPVGELESLMKQARYDEAKVLAGRLLEEAPDDARVFSILSQIYLTEEDGARAVDAATRAADIEPSFADHRLWLARAYLLRASQSTLLSLWYAWKGKGQYQKAVELDPGNVQMRLELCLYYLLAPGIAGGSKDKARREAEIIEKQSPLFGAYAWASIWEREKELDKAELRLMQAVEMDTTSTLQAEYALGYFYHRNRRLADARAVFEEILAANPDDMNAMYHIGTTYLLEEKELEKAEDLFNVYLASEPRTDQPSHAMAHWRLGTVYHLQGETDLAIMHLNNAVELDPGNRQFKEALEAATKD